MHLFDRMIIMFRQGMHDTAAILAIYYVQDKYNLFEKLVAFLDLISL